MDSGFSFTVMKMMNHPMSMLRNDADGKIWLLPEVSVCYSHGFTKSEERQIMAMTGEYLETLILGTGMIRVMKKN